METGHAGGFSQDWPYRGSKLWQQPPLPATGPPGQQCPSGASASGCVLPCEPMKRLGGYVVWRPCSRDASPIFSLWLAKPPANPTVLSDLHTFLFLPYPQHHHYQKMLFGFVFFTSAILSMVGFCILFIKRKGHSDFALQTIKKASFIRLRSSAQINTAQNNPGLCSLLFLSASVFCNLGSPTRGLQGDSLIWEAEEEGDEFSECFFFFFFEQWWI